MLVHGGAGDIPDSRDEGKLIGCKQAARVGYVKLKETGSVLDAVEAAVKSMELDENFNAGKINIGSFIRLYINLMPLLSFRIWFSTHFRWNC